MMRRFVPTLAAAFCVVASSAAFAVSCPGLQALVGRTVQPYPIVAQDELTISGFILEQNTQATGNLIVGRLPRLPIEQFVGQAMTTFDLGMLVAQSPHPRADVIMAQEQKTGLSRIVGRTRQPYAIVAQDQLPSLGNIVSQERICGED